MVLARHREDLLGKVRREFWGDCLWIQIDVHYREQKHFQEAILYLVFNIVELNPTNNVGSMIHDLLKSFFFEKPEHRRGVYKQIRYEILPILWKNHWAMERKKQRKLTFRANELHMDGRIVEAHVVGTIVKPYIRDLN